MAGLVSVSLDLSKIDKAKVKDGKYVNMVVSLNNDTNQYGQNASIFHSQTKEEREAKANKVYVGNGKVVWNDGTIVNADKVEQVTNSDQNPTRENNVDDLLDF